MCEDVTLYKHLSNCLLHGYTKHHVAYSKGGGSCQQFFSPICLLPTPSQIAHYTNILRVLQILNQPNNKKTLHKTYKSGEGKGCDRRFSG